MLPPKSWQYNHTRHGENSTSEIQVTLAFILVFTFGVQPLSDVLTILNNQCILAANKLTDQPTKPVISLSIISLPLLSHFQNIHTLPTNF
jgi:hypothetical protein